MKGQWISSSCILKEVHSSVFRTCMWVFLLFCLLAEWPLSVYPSVEHVCPDGIIWAQASPPHSSRYCNRTDPWARGRSERREQRVPLRHLMPWNVLRETRKSFFHIGHNKNHAAWVNFGEDTCWTSALSSFRWLRKCSTVGLMHRVPLTPGHRHKTGLCPHWWLVFNPISQPTPNSSL